jgi:uncharacterized protein YjbI with pentapeptide repeats
VNCCNCKYRNCYNIDDNIFKCLELVHNRDVIRCIFHDINYLKGDNYEKNKEEVANRFYRKLSKYSFNNMPLKFVGYCLPFISFLNERFTRLIDFTDGTFYDGVNFSHATFSIVSFDSAKFSGEAHFDSAKFPEQQSFIQLHSP